MTRTINGDLQKRSCFIEPFCITRLMLIGEVVQALNRELVANGGFTYAGFGLTGIGKRVQAEYLGDFLTRQRNLP